MNERLKKIRKEVEFINNYTYESDVSPKRVLTAIINNLIQTIEQQQEEMQELQAACRLKQGHIDYIPTIRKEYEKQIQQQQEEIERYKRAINEAINRINREAFRTACDELEEALKGKPHA